MFGTPTVTSKRIAHSSAPAATRLINRDDRQTDSPDLSSAQNVVSLGGFFFVLWASFVLLTAPASAADDVENFYKGKRIRVIIGLNVGGGYDLYARSVIRHMSKHVPGNPTFIAENMLGAGGRTAANWLFSAAPRDGTVIGTVSQTAPMDQARKEDGVKFDTAQFNWIGNAVIDNQVTFTSVASGLATIEDVKAKGGLLCGGTGASANSVTYPIVLGNLLDVGIRSIAGYQGGPNIFLAMERGEVNCNGSNSWASINASSKHILDERKVNLLVLWANQRSPDVSAYVGHDIPLIFDFAKTNADRQALSMLISGSFVGRPLFAPPGVPSDRIDALRKAFDDTMKDPEFLNDAKRSNLDIDPLGGAKLQELVTQVAGASESVMKRVNELLTPRNPIQLDKK